MPIAPFIREKTGRLVEPDGPKPGVPERRVGENSVHVADMNGTGVPTWCLGNLGRNPT